MVKNCFVFLLGLPDLVEYGHGTRSGLVVVLVLFHDPVLGVRHLALGRRARGRGVRVVVDREADRARFRGRGGGGRVRSLLHLGVLEGVVEEMIRGVGVV